MDFELSDDQLALRDGARELLDGLAPATRVRTVVDAGGGIDHGLWKAMVEQGWTAVEVPEDRGGLGLGAVEVAVLVEEIGRHVAPAPFLSTLLALGALARAGRDDWAGRLAGGDAIGCVAWSRPGRGDVRASRDRLTGRGGASAPVTRTRRSQPRRPRSGAPTRRSASWRPPSRCTAGSGSRGSTTCTSSSSAPSSTR